MLQTFNVAGVATDKEGKVKVKYANNLKSRQKVLEKDGYQNISFVQFKNRMTKIALMELLLTHPQFQENNCNRQMILEEYKRLGDIKLKRDKLLTLALGVSETPKLVNDSLMAIM